MNQKFFNPKDGSEVKEPMGQERSMRGFVDKKPVAKKPVMKPGSRPLAHHPHDIVGARKKPHMPMAGKGRQPSQVPDIGPNYDGLPHERPNESKAHEAKETKAEEAKEKRTGREIKPRYDATLSGGPTPGPVAPGIPGVGRGHPSPEFRPPSMQPTGPPSMQPLPPIPAPFQPPSQPLPPVSAPPGRRNSRSRRT